MYSTVSVSTVGVEAEEGFVRMKSFSLLDIVPCVHTVRYILAFANWRYLITR
jgi:hypothetical protein